MAEHVWAAMTICNEEQLHAACCSSYNNDNQYTCCRVLFKETLHAACCSSTCAECYIAVCPAARPLGHLLFSQLQSLGQLTHTCGGTKIKRDSLPASCQPAVVCLVLFHSSMPGRQANMPPRWDWHSTVQAEKKCRAAALHLGLGQL